MVFREIFIRRWWMILLVLFLVVLGYGYSQYQIKTDSYVVYYPNRQVENDLDEIIKEQQEKLVTEQMEAYVIWRQDFSEELTMLEEGRGDIVNLYSNSLYGRIYADNLIRLANGQDTVIFDGNIPPDFFENKDKYGEMKEASMLNTGYIARFFGLEQFDLAFLSGIFFAVCFWGGHYENRTVYPMKNTMNGKKYCWKIHMTLLGLTVLTTGSGWFLSFAGSGLLGVPQYWSAMLRGYKGILFSFNNILISMTVLEFCLHVLVVRICNGILFYLIGNLFVRIFHNIRYSFLGGFSVLLVCYFVSAMLIGRGKSSLFQFGHQKDISYWVTHSEWMDSMSMISLQVGGLVVVILTAVVLVVWLLLETRNPYRVERRKR